MPDDSRHVFVCFADTHGRRPAHDEAGSVTAYLHAGDIYNRQDPLPKETTAWIASHGSKTFFVRGNHDYEDRDRIFEQMYDISGRVHRVAAGLFLAGIGWAGTQFWDLPLDRDLDQQCQIVLEAARQIDAKDDRLILLTHYPPRFPEFRDVQGDRPDNGLWSNGIRKLVQELRPLAVVQGHVHQWSQTANELMIGDRRVLIVSPGPTGCVLDVDPTANSVTHRWL